MKLNKEQMARLSKLRDEYRKAVTALKAEKDNAEAEIAKAVSLVNDRINDLNAIIENANELRDQIQSEIADYIGEKSDKWQEGERGQAFEDWRAQWDCEVETLDSVDEITIEVEVAEELLDESEYPTEPES